jgi:transposase
MFSAESLSSGRMIPLGPSERAYFEEIVPAEHFLRRLPVVVDFESFRPILASCYHETLGATEWDPVVMLKLEVLSYQYKLSDRDVIMTARFNIAFRLFLGLSLKSPLPHDTSMTHFRQRLGEQRLQEIFDTLVRQARQVGLVKDRLRLKDATHMIANMAVPTVLGLVAQTRDQLLKLLRPLAPQRTAEEEQRAAAIRVAMEDAKDEIRLLERVTHLPAILAWADAVPEQEIFKQQTEAAQQSLLSALATAHKILADRDNPKARDKTLSFHEADARRTGQHSPPNFRNN